jgi:hypothetical protein
LLEGSHGSLDVLILKLSIDTRHRDIDFIDRAPIASRAFSGWSMACPDFTPVGSQRLASYLSSEARPMDDFRRLLADMIGEQSSGAAL